MTTTPCNGRYDASGRTRPRPPLTPLDADGRNHLIEAIATPPERELSR